MAVQLLVRLEAAAQILLSPPNVVTSEQRHRGEAVFIEFRRTRAPLSICKFILETSRVDYVLFEAAGLIKEAGMREWIIMEERDITEYRNYLLRYVIDRPTLAPFVREKMLEVIAALIKRGSVDDGGAERRVLLQEVQQLIANGNLSQQLVGCGIILAIMQEFTINNTSVMGLRWSTHAGVNKEFEKEDLKDIFTFIMRVLREALTGDAPQQLIKQLITILANALTWDFEQNSLGALCVFSHHLQIRQTRPPLTWREVLVNEETMIFFFSAYWKVRTDPQLAHHAMTCLRQFVMFEGPIFETSGDTNFDQTAYYTVYLQSLFRLLDSVKILDREALGVSFILSRIVKHIEILPCKLVYGYLDHLTKYTCLFGEGAAEEECICVENTYYMEAFTELLRAWFFVPDHMNEGSALSTAKDFRKNFCAAAVKIIETYLQCHLSPPIGVRGLGREVEAEEIADFEEDDRERFSVQLSSIGFLAREVPEHVLPLLARLLEECTSRFCAQLQQFNQKAPEVSDYRIMENLSEDIHWLVLLAGHTLTVSAKFETTIPSKILQYSEKQFDSVDIADVNVSLKVLTSPEQHIHNIPGAEESADHVVRLVAAVLRLCEVERRAYEAKLGNFMSPQVGCSMMWFLQEWILSYFLRQEKASAPLRAAFGVDSEASSWVLNFILGKIESNLKYGSAEPSLISDTIGALHALVSSSDKAAHVVKSPGFINILNLQSVCLSDAFPHKAKQGYYQAMFRAAAGIRSDGGCRQNYLKKCVEPILIKFKAVISQENFVRTFHQAKNQNEIINCLDAFIGAARWGCPKNDDFATLLNPVLSELPALFGLYHNYQEIVEMILEVLYAIGSEMLTYLSFASADIFFATCVQMIQTFANYNSSRLKLQAASEDDTFNDIQLLLKLLNALLSSDVADHVLGADLRFHPQEGPPDVAMTALSILMRLLNADFMAHPPIRTLVFRTISTVTRAHGQTISNLQEEMLRPILAATEAGLRAYDTEIQIECLCLLDKLVHRLSEDPKWPERPSYSLIRPFLHIIFDMAVLQKVPSDLQTILPNTLFRLATVYAEEYKQAVRAVVHSESDLGVAERLSLAFESLTQCILDEIDLHKRRLRSRTRNDLMFIHKYKMFLSVTQGLFIQ